ncbi:hypothetical protein [Tabrizicola sp.]|uniref:hypothetical protein n=1 Tax=Tabrizicola sp. TaxID=2005166 RepID=UPI0025EF9550|nr:hypothetical protein [Tabrizicola sp.]MBY0351940.1 hypothetical protein [Tabrizicola sp.]
MPRPTSPLRIAKPPQGGRLVAVTELVPPSGAPFALDQSRVTITILAAGKAVEVKGCPTP